MSGKERRSDGLLGERGNERRRAPQAPPVLHATALLLDSTPHGTWQEPGTRRQAFYTDLRPGTYRFRVIASNNDGVWNEEGASVEIVIAPAWYQTRAFLMFIITLAGMAAWLGYRLRLRQVARALNARFDARLEERTRVARDLHDTLLQTVQGSKMVADSALDRPDDAPALARALQQVSAWLAQAGQEGRAAVNALRMSTTERNDLAEAFRRAIDDCRRQRAIEGDLTVTGAAKEMHPVVHDEIYRIGYEAIRNACMHSRGSRLVVGLGYGQISHCASRTMASGWSLGWPREARKNVSASRVCANEQAASAPRSKSPARPAMEPQSSSQCLDASSSVMARTGLLRRSDRCFLVVPHIDAGDPVAEQRAQLEEQRRLFFVGMTRTTDILVFSSYSQLPTNIAQNLRVRRGAFIPGANAYRVFASPFLEETGPTLPPAVRGVNWIA